MIAFADSAADVSESYVFANLALSSFPLVVAVIYAVPAAAPSCAIVTVAEVALSATVAVPNFVPSFAAEYTFTISPAFNPVTAIVSLVPTLLFVIVTCVAVSVVTGSAMYVFATLALSNIPVDLTDTYTLPAPVPNCVIDTVADVALLATVAVPKLVPAVAAEYTVTMSPAFSPVTATVSAVPVALFVTVITVAASAVVVGSAVYVFAVLVLSNPFVDVLVTYTVPAPEPNCVTLILAVVALSATVAEPNAVPPVAAAYAFITSPASRPVTAIVSAVPR